MKQFSLLLLAANITAGNICPSKTVIVPIDDDHAIVINRVEKKTITIAKIKTSNGKQKKIKRYAKVFVKNQVPKLNLQGIKR